MRRIVAVAILAASLAVLAFGVPAGVSAPSACPNNYEFTATRVDPATYEPFDANQDGAVCVSLRKGAQHPIVDDKTIKKH